MQVLALRSCVSLVCICLASQTIGNAQTDTRSTWTFTPKLKPLSDMSAELPAGTVTLSRSDTLRVGLYIDIATNSTRTDTHLGFDLLAGAIHFYSDDGLEISDIGPVVRTLRAQGNGWTSALDSATPDQNSTIGASGVSLFGPLEEETDEDSWAFLWLDINSTVDPRGAWCGPVSGSCEIFLGELSVSMADMPLDASGTLTLKAAGVLAPTEKVQVETLHRRGLAEIEAGNTVEYSIAEDVNVVPQDWSLKPGDLSAGDSFRLLFVSSTTRDATSSDISDYNTHVQNAATVGHTDIQSYSSEFRVLGSTSAVDARDNTNTTYTSTVKGVPVYWLDGTRLADQYEDFYDGSWDSRQDKNEAGNSVSGAEAWTGTANDGTASAPLGATDGQVRYGHPARTNDHLDRGLDTSSTVRHFYGLSPVFQVMGQATLTGPSLSSVAVNGATLTLTYDTALDETSIPSPTDYTVTVAGSAVTVTAVAVSGSAVTLTLAAVVQAGQTVAVSYAVPATDPVRDAGGTDAGALMTEAVINSTPAVAPALSWIAVDGATLTLIYSEGLDETSKPATSAYTVTVAGSAVTVSAVDVSGTRVTLTLAAAVQTGQTVTLSYTVPGTNPVQDVGGTDAAALTNQMVVNNTGLPVLSPTHPVRTIGEGQAGTYSVTLSTGQHTNGHGSLHDL